MQETMGMTTSFHLFFLFLVAMAVFVNLTSVFMFIVFDKVEKIIKFITPAFHFFLSTVIFTGLILAVFVERYFGSDIVLMVLATIAILGLEITRYVKQKKALKNPTSREPFLIFAKSVYIFDVVILGVVYLAVI